MVNIPSTLTIDGVLFVFQILPVITLFVSLFVLQKYEFDDPKGKKIRKRIRIFISIVLPLLVGLGIYRFYYIPNTQWQAIEQAYKIEVTEKNGSLKDGESVEITYIKDGDTLDGVVGVTGDTATVYTDDEPLPVVN